MRTCACFNFQVYNVSFFFTVQAALEGSLSREIVAPDWIMSRKNDTKAAEGAALAVAGAIDIKTSLHVSSGKVSTGLQQNSEGDRTITVVSGAVHVFLFAPSETHNLYPALTNGAGSSVSSMVSARADCTVLTPRVCCLLTRTKLTRGLKC